MKESSHKDPPSEICHPAHPEHKPKLMTAAGAPFLCDGCKEPGYGPRYSCDCGGSGQSMDLHTRCALARDPLSDLDLQTLVDALSDLDLQTLDPLFGYGEQFEFPFLHEAPSSPAQEEGRTRNSPRPGMAGSETTERGSMDMEELMLGSPHKDPPSEICHPAHPEHKLKLTTAAGAPFLCDGCQEPGYGPRNTCDGSGEPGHTFDLHTRCALADDPPFDLHTVVHPLFGYGKHFEFRFLHEAASSSPVEGTRACDACGDPTRGFVYHCSGQDVDIHPGCASLPDRFLLNGRAFDLHRRASRPCALCPDDEGQFRWFWAYRCYEDGEAIDLHVACLKETARRSWEAYYYRKHDDDVGGGAKINVNGGMLVDNRFSSSIVFDKFGEVGGTVASFITALVFGKLIVKM